MWIESLVPRRVAKGSGLHPHPVYPDTRARPDAIHYLYTGTAGFYPNHELIR